MTPAAAEQSTPIDNDRLSDLSVNRYNVSWQFPGPDSTASTPLGNGDLLIYLFKR